MSVHECGCRKNAYKRSYRDRDDEAFEIAHSVWVAKLRLVSVRANLHAHHFVLALVEDKDAEECHRKDIRTALAGRHRRTHLDGWLFLDDCIDALVASGEEVLELLRRGPDIGRIGAGDGEVGASHYADFDRGRRCDCDPILDDALVCDRQSDVRDAAIGRDSACVDERRESREVRCERARAQERCCLRSNRSSFSR